VTGRDKHKQKDEI